MREISPITFEVREILPLPVCACTRIRTIQAGWPCGAMPSPVWISSCQGLRRCVRLLLYSIIQASLFSGQYCGGRNTAGEQGKVQAHSHVSRLLSFTLVIYISSFLE